VPVYGSRFKAIVAILGVFYDLRHLAPEFLPDFSLNFFLWSEEGGRGERGRKHWKTSDFPFPVTLKKEGKFGQCWTYM
jgi:hypothetical protein